MGQCSSKKATKGVSDAKSSDGKGNALQGGDLGQKLVVFVLGGPGCGKGTQCARLKETCGFEHLSSGDLLRTEVESGSEKAQQLQDDMSAGRLVPDAFILELLRKAAVASTAPVVLVDGFPRSVEQAKLADTALPATAVIFFDCSEDVMKERILGRAQTSGRIDDNEETVSKRLEIFNTRSSPVRQHYADLEILHVVSAEQEPDAVFEDVSGIMTAMQERQKEKEAVTTSKEADEMVAPAGALVSGKGETAAPIVAPPFTAANGTAADDADNVSRIPGGSEIAGNESGGAVKEDEERWFEPIISESRRASVAEGSSSQPDTLAGDRAQQDRSEVHPPLMPTEAAAPAGKAASTTLKKQGKKDTKAAAPKVKMTATAPRPSDGRRSRSVSLAPSPGDDAMIASAKLVASQALAPGGGSRASGSLRGSQDLSKTQRTRTRTTSTVPNDKDKSKPAGWLYGAN